MSTPISLIQMPEDIIKHILKYLDFPTILVLRKVCHDLRNFINDTKPASHLMEIYVNVFREHIIFNLFLPRSTFIRYCQNRDGCLVKNFSSKKETEWEIDEDFVTVFCKDFDIVLRHQKTVLKQFTIDFVSLNATIKERVLESVKGTLKSLNHPLQVKSLDLEVNDHHEILSILPYLDPKPLQSIYINDYLERFNAVLNLDEVGQLEQWKQAKELTVHGFLLPDLSQNAKHFSKINFQFREFNTEEIILLKEMFLCSLTLYEMEIHYHVSDCDNIKQKLIEAFGQPTYLVNPFIDEDINWFFRIPDTNQFLRISFFFLLISTVLNNQMYLEML